MLASYSPRERDARSRGIPAIGAGAIYPLPESEFVCEAFKIPDYFHQCFGLDVGWNKTAAVWLAHDVDNDVAYAYSEHYQSQQEPLEHAQAIWNRGKWIPGVIDPAARGRGQKDGESLMSMYQELLPNLGAAKNAVEAGIYSVWTRLATGRLKIFSTCQHLLGELRIYRRDDKGNVVKENDHLCDALRYAVVSGLDRATVRPPSMWSLPNQNQPQHKYEYDPLTI